MFDRFCFWGEKNVKTVNSKLVIFISPCIFQKLSSESQAKLNIIHESDGVLVLHPLPVLTQCTPLICDFVFRKKHNAIFLLLIFYKLQRVVSVGKNDSHGNILCVWKVFLPFKFNHQNWTTAERQWRHSNTDTSSVAVSLSSFLLFSILHHLFN